MEFKEYTSRVVVKKAHEIMIGDRILNVRDDIWSCNGTWFTSNKKPECYDFIIKMDDRDIYLCPYDVFTKQYVVE